MAAAEPEHSGAAVSHGALSRKVAAPKTPDQVRSLVLDCVTSWRGVGSSDVEVKPLSAGLTNELYKVSLKTGKALTSQPRCVLFRVFGQEVESFYSPEQERIVFSTLAQIGLGPACFGQGDGWRIEEWHTATPVLVQDLTRSSVLAEIAALTARFHKLGSQTDLPKELPRVSSTQLRLRQWAAECSAVQYSNADQWSRVGALRLSELLGDAHEWLPGYLNSAPHVPGLGTDVVFCHNDIQENNLLRTSYGLRIIDFEYAHFNEQAADVSNFFCEMMIDYTTTEPPYFRPTNVRPSTEQRRLFASVYLSEYLEQNVSLGDARVDQFLSACDRYELASHLLWGMWGLIRAANATGDGFDFIGFSEFRFGNYRLWKRKLLQSRAAGSRCGGGCALATAAAVACAGGGLAAAFAR
eukprot:TRINITY_DN12727_c0_g1_i1.p1 TRINITY_DN12727_c0_g1~~TRINITY_DN12727_c0_g1_i1.p1  ORF type:complete len:411 (+),score=99.66 TRINITY_DN12727_c0_g1_i1:76-1308(+)